MSKPLMLAMCSMIALFGAMYLVVDYLNSGTDLSPSETSHLAVPLTSPDETPDSPVQVKDDPTVSPPPSATRTPQTGVAAAQSTPTATATSAPSTATAAPTVTSTLQPTPTASPTATPVPSPTPTVTAQTASSPAIAYSPTATPAAPTSAPTVVASATSPPAAQLIERVTSAEKQVRSGRIEAEFGSGEDIDSTSKITFDFGDSTHPPRIHFESTYSGSESSRTTELIIIGDRYWERADGGAWAEVGAREGVWGQVQSYLPGLPAVADTSRIRVVDDQLSWTDEVRDVDVTLAVDPETGIPRQLRRDSRSSATSVSVTYFDWNAPVDVQAPRAP